MYYKTDREVGGAYKEYTVTLKDQRGLSSEKLETGTTINKPAEETVLLNTGTQVSGDGSNALPFIIQAAGTTSEAQIIISCTSSGTTVHCTVTDVNTGISTEYNGNPVSVPLGLNGGNEKLYEVKYNTKGYGYNPTTLKTKYYKILKLHTVTFNANGGKFADDSTAKTESVLHGRTVTAPSTSPTRVGNVFVGWYKEEDGTTEWNFTDDTIISNTIIYAKWSDKAVEIKSDEDGAWKKLKEEAAKTNGVSVIVIEGEIKATTDSGNSGEITIGRNLTIQGKTGAASDKLDANGQNHRIFKVTGGKTLTLKNLTLMGGKPAGSDEDGYGGGILVKGGTLNMTDCAVTGNTAEAGGGIYAKKDGTVASVTISGGTIGGAGADANKTLSSNSGGGIYIGEYCSLTMKDNVKITGNETRVSGGGIYADTDSTLLMKDCTVSGNKASGSSGGLHARGNLTMTGCTVSDNKTTGDSGGGVYVAGTAKIEDVTKIYHNEANVSGGGIYVESGDVTLTNATIGGEQAYYGTALDKTKANRAKDDGGGIYVASGTLTMTGSTVSSNTARKGGGMHVNGGTVKIKTASIIKLNQANPSGGGIYSKGTLVISDDAKIEGNEANFQGGGIHVASGGSLNMTGSTITGNKAYSGGGVFATKDGSTPPTVTISGCTIGGEQTYDDTDPAKTKGNKAESGGGITVVSCTLNIEDSTLSFNKTNGSSSSDIKGGGIKATSATLNIKGCTFTHNDSSNGIGGGIETHSSTLTMTDCTLTHNKAGNGGGGIQTNSISTLNIKGCTFTHNDSGNGTGGGIETRNSTLTMTDCTLTYNKAGNGGGGIFVGGGSLTMNGGTITGNTANEGGGVYVADGAFTMKGSSRITPSSGADENAMGKNEVFLKNGKMITVPAALTGTHPVARITPAAYNTSTQVLTGGAVSSEHAKFTVTTESGAPPQEWIIKNDGYLQKPPITIKSTDSLAWKKLKDAVAAAQDGDTIRIDGEIKATSAGGNSGEIEVKKNITIQGKKTDRTDTLNANKDAFGTAPFRIFKVEAGKKLTLENLTLKNGKNNETASGGSSTPKGKGGAIYSKGELEIRNVLITDCEAKYSGGGIYCSMSGSNADDERKLVIENTEVTSCKAPEPDYGTGGGVYIVGENCLMNVKLSDVKIKNNEASSSAAGLCLYGSHGATTTADSVVLTRVTLHENKLTDTGARGGAGMVFATYDRDSAITLKNCTVTKNESKTSGGGISLHSSAGGLVCGKLILEDSSVTENKAQNGGGIYVNLSNLVMKNTVLTSNTATMEGGGVYVADGTFTMKDSSRITPSSGADENAIGKNEVFLKNGKMITVDGALTGTTPVARITPDTYNTTTQVLTGGAVGTEHGKFTVTPKDLGSGNTQQWEINSTGFLQKTPVVIDSSGDAWKKLKDAVAAADDGDVFTIIGEIKATNDTDNSGEIEVKKNITIQGKKTDRTDTLNANSTTTDSDAPSQKHRIFKVEAGKKLTLENLTLKGGQNTTGAFGGAITVTGSSTAELTDCIIEDCQANKGGAIGCYSGTTVTLTNTTIQKCKATERGGAIYASGATVTLTGCTLTGNEAVLKGGAIYAVKAGISPTTPSAVTISGGTIGGTNPTDANKATGTGTDNGMGGAIYIGEACKLTLKDSAQVIGNTAVYNGAGIYTKGTLTTENCTITDNKTTGANNNTGGGGVYVESGSVEIKDATKIYHNYTDASGGGIYVNDGTVTLKNATIGGEQFYDGTDSGKTKGNKAQYCGGIYVKNGTITMENCTLNSNAALYGGGIQADNGNHTVKDCTLTNNEAYLYGGGIYVKGGSLTLNNTTIGGEQFYDGTDSGKTKGNKAKSGGGVYIEGNGTSFTMNGGSIQYNKTIDGKGGGVYIKGEGISFTMNGGKITQCKADVTSPSSTEGRGGGIYIYGDNASSPINITIKGTAEISHNESTCQGTASGGGIYGESNSIITVSENATIKNNKAKGFGGGVYIKDTFKFTGGTITENTASLGAGIFSEKSSTTLEMSGNARVTNDNDIYLYNNGVITITGGALTGTAPVARITVLDNKYLPSTQVLAAGAGVTLANETYKFAVTPQTSTAQPWTVGGNGYLKQGRYTEVPYGQLETYLANNASATEVNYIEVTGISAGDLKGTAGSSSNPANPGLLGQKIKAAYPKKVALKLPNSISGLTDMSYCFALCKNLISVENIPSGVKDMQACFYGCENLTTVPAIPATVRGMLECFRFCKSLTQCPDIPSSVTDMGYCFENCTSLKRVKLECNYRANEFNNAFKGCTVLEVGGIKVPSAQLTNYQNAASAMGTSADKFAALP